MKKYWLIIVWVMTALVGCSNDESDLVTVNLQSAKADVVQYDDTITKVIGISPDFVGTSEISFQDYSDVLEKTLGMDARQLLGEITKGNIHSELKGSCPNASVSITQEGISLFVKEGMNLGDKRQVGVVLSNLKGKLFLKFDVSVVDFPKLSKEKVSHTRSSGAYLPQTLVTILSMHQCPTSQNRLEMQCPAFLQLSSHETSKTITPLFLTDDKKFHVEARLYHLYCSKKNGETLTLRVSNSYTYFEDVPCTTGWIYYKGDVPLAFSNGETERINFLYY